MAIEEGREVAFVSLDIFPPSQQPLVLYTLAVPTLLREKGIGSRVLAEVERLAMLWSEPESGFEPRLEAVDLFLAKISPVPGIVRFR